MRVLIVLKDIPSEFVGYKSDLIVSLIKAHQAVGYEVVLGTIGGEARHSWRTIYRSPQIVRRVWSSIVRAIFSEKRATQLLRTSFMRAVSCFHRHHPIDIVLAYCTSETPALLALRIKETLSIPYVICEHRTIYQRQAEDIKNLSRDFLSAMQSANSVVAVSPQLAETMNQLGLGKHIDSLPNSIPNTFFTPPSQNSIGVREWSRDSFLFASWTNWRDFKRLDLLLEAFYKAFKKNNTIRLVVAGRISSTMKSDLTSYIIQAGLKPYVQLYGEASRKEIHQLAHSCDCCVISSDHETFGLPAIEAMAAGKPVVTTRCGGPESIVTSRTLGRVVEPGDSQALADAMLDVVVHQATFEPWFIQRNTYERYSEDALAHQWKQLYAQVLSV